MPMPQRKSKPPQHFQSNNTNNSLLISSGCGNLVGSGSPYNNNARSPYYATNSYPPHHHHHHHHHHPNSLSLGALGLHPAPIPSTSLQQPQQPPLITDTLTACLDVNGTYVCTSYSPRCYIIQKVTPTSVTVTPTQTIGLGLSQGPTLGARNCPAVASGSYSGNSGYSRPKFSNSSYHHNHHQHSYSAHKNQYQSNQPLDSLPNDAKSTSQAQDKKQNDYLVMIAPKKESGEGPSISGASNAGGDDQAGRFYMNGEVGSSIPFGESTSSSQMGVAPQCSNDSGTDTPEDTRLFNGVKDGSNISKDQMALNRNAEQVNKVDVAAVPSNLSSNVQTLTMNDDDQLPSDTPIDELRQLLATQLEYYFSPENLSNDKFLVSQMDSDQYVYISTVANFNMIKKLSSDLDLITNVLKESKHVQVHSDGKRVRPVSNRTVVILRGIPQHTPIEEIKALFEKDNSPRCNNCEFAFNDSWYLSFDSDDEAVRAHRYLREDVREFKGHPIMARIKSRPTTLLSQGVGVNPTVKNGYNPPTQTALPQYLTAPYVSLGSQSGPTVVQSAPIFPTGQQLTSAVFTIPSSPYAGFGAQVPWTTNYYDINSAMGSIFSLNGLQQPQSQPSPSFNKGIQMAPRHRNTKSETETNYYRVNRGAPRRTGDNSNGNGGGVVTSHLYGGGIGANQNRKNSGPTPLLGIAPLPINSHHASHSHNHHGHSVSSGNSSNATNFNRNTGHYNMGLSSHNVPHNVPDSYHYNSRPYRGNDNRPRSSLGTRKPPRSYDDDANYENHNSTTVVSNRGNPSARLIPPSVSPQPPSSQGVSSPHPQVGKTNFDLEANAFPPLPGAVNPSVKNGDIAYEGRLSDVVKGVKNLKVAHQTPPGDKEEVGVNTVHSEVVVSAEESARSSTYVVSAASPTKELDLPNDLSSQSCASGNKKEFREVGVGSADDSHEIRTACSKVASISGGKETADKSTRTDTALLHGDHASTGNRPNESKYPGVKGGSGDPHQHSGNDNRKSVPQSTKSPLVNKRGVPGFQQHGPVMSTVAVGSDVPYSSQKDTSSPAKLSATSGHVNTNVDSSNSNSGGDKSGATYVAKIQADNNSRSSSSVSSTNHRTNLNTNDKEAFPTPGFAKSNVPTNKLVSGGLEQSSKEAARLDDEEKLKKEGALKKVGDENICSNEDRDGSIRLSYAQVAQSRKEKVSPNSSIQLPQVSSSSSSIASQSGSVSGASCNNAQGNSLNEDKRRPASETKESRPLSKTNLQRGNSGGGLERDGDRGRGYNRRFSRNRMSSENSQEAGGNYGGRPPRRRSPK